jgi:hypothetical protein
MPRLILRLKMPNHLLQPIRKIRHDPIHPSRHNPPHLIRLVHRPSRNLQIRKMRIIRQIRRNQVPSRANLPRPASASSLHGIRQQLLQKQPGHNRWIVLPQAIKRPRIKRKHNRPRNVSRLLQSSRQCVVHPPRDFIFQLEIKHDIISAPKSKNLLKRRNAFTNERVIEPPASIQLLHLRKRQSAHGSRPVSRPLHVGIMHRHKLRIPRKLQISLDESSPHLHCRTKCRQSILGRITRSPAVSNNPRLSHRALS